MIIEVNTDHNIRSTASLVSQVEDVVRGTLDIYQARLTRVIVHLSDTNGDKGGMLDKRCLIEARIQNMPDLAVTDHGENVIDTLQSACDKMFRALGSALGKVNDRRPEANPFSTVH